MEIFRGLLDVGLLAFDFDHGSGRAVEAEKTPFRMTGAESAAELAEEAKLAGEDDLLVISESLGLENFDNLHAVAHVEAYKKVVEDEELEVGFVKIDERSGKADR